MCVGAVVDRLGSRMQIKFSESALLLINSNNYQQLSYPNKPCPNIVDYIPNRH